MLLLLLACNSAPAPTSDAPEPATLQVEQTLHGLQVGDGFGMRLVCLPDLDGDGDAELLVAAPEHDGRAGQDSGRVSLHRGSPAGLEAASWSLEGTVAGGHLGQDLAVAGDVNGDGRVDLLLASGWVEPQHMEPGRAWWVPGTADGFASAPTWSSDPWLPGRDLAPMGDSDGDGFDDFALGAALWETRTGRVELFRGSPDGPQAAGVVDGAAAQGLFGIGLHAVDGALVVAAPGEGGLVVLRQRDGAWHRSGTLQAPPGDALGFAMDRGEVDGDPAPELLVGAFWHGEGIGRAALVEVGPDGLTPEPWARRGEAPRTSYAWATLLADLDGDGLDELIVGSDGWDGPLGSEGLVEVFAGGPALAADDAPRAQLAGTAENDRLGSEVAACDVDGDGVMELMIGVDRDGRDSPGAVLVTSLP